MSKQVKKFSVALLIAFFMFVFPFFTARASEVNEDEKNMSLHIEDEKYIIEPSPVVRAGRMLIPMRDFFEMMGAEVKWSAEEQTALAYWKDVEIAVPAGRSVPEVNGQRIPVDVQPDIINDCVYVPVRFAAESFDLEVEWKEEKYAVMVSGSGDEKISPEILKELSEKDREEINGPEDENKEKEEEEKDNEENELIVVSTQKGEASWYGSKFHGQGTASGETFDMYDYTAAHRELPFGTKVRVTFLETGRDVKVRINDRGPHVEGRIIDLSRAAAEAIGLRPHGVGQVKLEVLEQNH